MIAIWEHLRDVLNVSPDAVFVVDRSGAIIEINDVATDLFGYSARELIGRPADVLVPDHLHTFHSRGRDSFLTRPSRQQWASGSRVRARTKAGQEIPVEITVGPLGEGDDLAIVVSVRNVTARATREDQYRATIEDLERRLKSSEQDFRRTNEHFKLFLKYAPASIALVDRQMRYLIVSDRWLVDFGLTGRDIHGLCHYDVLSGIPEKWREQHRRCLAGEVVVSDEDSFVRPDERTEWARRELHPWRASDGRIGGMLMFVELITARKNAETALKKSYLELEHRVAERTAELERMKNDATRANTQKSWFVAAASHDLRQPLQASLAYLSVLARKTDRDDLEDLCTKARQPLKAMSDILDVLLDISDLESGHVKPQLRDFPLGELLTRIVGNVQHQATDKGLRLSCLPTDATVRSDPRLLERVISNFVTNAIRYTDRGLIGIYSEVANGQVCVSVTDTGIGIPADAITAIFEDHVQLSNPARDRRKGLGLGLSIAKRIADALGHRITVHSEVGSGSSFTIELPLAQGAAEPIADQPAPAPSETNGHPVVLLIDDDQDVAEAMQMLLQSYSFETYMAHSRDAALLMLESGLHPGLVLCDYRMPGTNGIDVIRQVRSALAKEVPAVLMTGDMGLTQCPEDLTRCALLHKPVDVEKFFSVIGTLAA